MKTSFNMGILRAIAFWYHLLLPLPLNLSGPISARPISGTLTAKRQIWKYVLTILFSKSLIFVAGIQSWYQIKRERIIQMIQEIDLIYFIFWHSNGSLNMSYFSIFHFFATSMPYFYPIMPCFSKKFLSLVDSIHIWYLIVS